MLSFQCQNHSQPVTLYCQDHTCAQRLLCNLCEHEHDKLPVQQLIEGDHIKELLKIFSTFKCVIIDNLNRMEQELNNNLLSRQPIQASTLEQFDQYLSDLTNEQQTLKAKIQNRLSAIINAIKSPDYDQGSQMHFDQRRKEQHSKSYISQAQQQQEFIKKQRQSKIFKINPSPLSKMEETQQLLPQPNRKEEKVLVQRLKELCTQDWPWKMTSSTICCCIFVSKFDMKLLGFMQPCLYKSATNNYQKKSAVITVGIYHKKNLTKQPILLEKFTLRHSKMNIVGDCYELLFSKPVQLKELEEYSLAIWPSRVLFCHYFSIAAPVNDYIAFQTQDFNDNPKIKRSEDFPQVISTYRAGLVPYLIVDPRQ